MVLMYDDINFVILLDVIWLQFLKEHNYDWHFYFCTVIHSYLKACFTMNVINTINKYVNCHLYLYNVKVIFQFAIQVQLSIFY